MRLVMWAIAFDLMDCTWCLCHEWHDCWCGEASLVSIIGHNINGTWHQCFEQPKQLHCSSFVIVLAWLDWCNMVAALWATPQKTIVGPNRWWMLLIDDTRRQCHKWLKWLWVSHNSALSNWWCWEAKPWVTPWVSIIGCCIGHNQCQWVPIPWLAQTIALSLHCHFWSSLINAACWWCHGHHH